MTARKTLPKDRAAEDRQEYEKASKEADSMDGVQVSVGPPINVGSFARGNAVDLPRDKALKKMSPDQREDDIVEKDDRFRRPIFKSDRAEQDDRYKSRQGLNRLKSSGGPR